MDVELGEIVAAEDPELAQLHKQNNYFRDSWIGLGDFIPVTDSTHFETGNSVKGAGEYGQIRNNPGRTFGPTINASNQIRIELKQRQLELDPNKTPPKAEPAKQPTPEIDKICST